MTLQPFLNYNFPGGWYLTSSPIITANWNADSSRNVWTILLAGGFGKILHIGKLPVNLQVQAFYRRRQPDPKSRLINLPSVSASVFQDDHALRNKTF